MMNQVSNKIDERLELFLANGYSEDILQAILKLEKACFPEGWQYDDPPAYFKKRLEQKTSINLFLKENDEFIGYCLAVPLGSEFNELKNYDADLVDEKDTYYIETIEILPNARGKGGAKKLLEGVCGEALSRGINSFAIHARKINKLNEKVKKVFAGKIISTREIEYWEPAIGEPYEYIKWKIDK